MKMRVLKDYTLLDAWKKHPYGYVVLRVPPTAKIEAVYTGRKISLECASPNANRALRQLEKIRELFDIDPYGMAPRVVIVMQDIAYDPRFEQFMRHAALVVDV